MKRRITWLVGPRQFFFWYDLGGGDFKKHHKKDWWSSACQSFFVMVITKILKDAFLRHMRQLCDRWRKMNFLKLAALIKHNRRSVSSPTKDDDTFVTEPFINASQRSPRRVVSSQFMHNAWRHAGFEMVRINNFNIDTVRQVGLQC